MDSYWSLCEYQSSIRKRGFVTLHKHLSARTGEFQYSLRRLIRGLGSNRKCARIGYFAALSTILSDFDGNLKIFELIDLMENSIPIGSSKEETTNAAIGRLLCIKCFLDADFINDEVSILKVIESLRNILTRVDRRLYVQVTKMISNLLNKAFDVSCISNVIKNISQDFPNSLEDLCERNCILLLVMLSNHQKQCKKMHKVWIPLLYRTSEPNIFSFLVGLKTPWPISAFQMAVDLAIINNQFKKCWQLLCLALNIQKEKTVCAENEFVFLKIVQYIASKCLPNSLEGLFLIEDLNLKLVCPSTTRNRPISNSTITALASLICKSESDGFEARIMRFSTELHDDSNLLSMFFHSLCRFYVESKKEDDLFKLLKFFMKIFIERITNIHTKSRPTTFKETHYTCFIIDQISRTIKVCSSTSKRVNDDIAYNIISAGLILFLNREDEHISQTVLKLTQNLVYDMLNSEMIAANEVQHSIFNDNIKSYGLFKKLSNEFKSNIANFSKFKSIFKALKVRSILNKSVKSLKSDYKELNKPFLFFAWICLFHSIINEDNLASKDFFAVISESQTQEDLSTESSRWTEVLTDLILSMISNSSQSFHSLLISLFKSLSSNLDNYSVNVLLNAIIDKHEEEMEDRTEDNSNEISADDDDVHLSDFNECDAPDEADLAVLFRAASKKLKNERSPEVLFKLRCADYLSALLECRQDLLVECLPDVVRISHLPKSELASDVTDKIKSLLHIMGSYKKSNKEDNSHGVSVDICMQSLTNCLEHVATLNKNSEQRKLLGNTMKLMVEALCKSNTEESTLLQLTGLKSSISIIVDRFFSGKSDILQVKAFQEAVKRIPNYCPMLLEEILNCCASKEEMKPFRVTASAQIIQNLLTKDMIVQIKNSKLNTQLRDYLLWLFEQCSKRAKNARKCTLCFKLMTRVIRIGLLSNEDETLISSVLVKCNTDSDEVGGGFKNRCISTVDLIEKRNQISNKMMKANPKKLQNMENVEQTKSLDSKIKKHVQKNKHTEDQNQNSKSSLHSTEDEYNTLPFGLNPFKGLSSLLPS